VLAGQVFRRRAEERREEVMRRSAHALAGLALCGAALAGSGCAPSIPLRTYDGSVMVYPDDCLAPGQPTILAFLSADDRRCDRLIRPLRALSARQEVYLVGVLTYEDNSFVEQISSKRDILFHMMLDPRKRLVDYFGVNRYPTFLYLSPKGKVVARCYDIRELKPWYLPHWRDQALGRDHELTPEEQVLEAEEQPR
jgi:hypothetical protein